MTSNERRELFSRNPAALLGSRCASCGTVRFPASDLCPACQSTDVSSVPLSTSGILYTFTIVRNRPPGYVGEVPYAFGFVDLAANGLRVISTLIADELDDLAIGDTVDFELFALGTGEDALESYRYRRREAPP